jgi:hypothetical protein
MTIAAFISFFALVVAWFVLPGSRSKAAAEHAPLTRHQTQAA